MTGRRSRAEAWSIYLKRAQADLKAHTLLILGAPYILHAAYHLEHWGITREIVSDHGEQSSSGANAEARPCLRLRA